METASEFPSTKNLRFGSGFRVSSRFRVYVSGICSGYHTRVESVDPNRARGVGFSLSGFGSRVGVTLGRNRSIPIAGEFLGFRVEG